MSDGFTITLDDQAVQAALTALSRRLSDLTPAMEDIGRVLVNITEDAFQSEASPFGGSWAQLSTSYVERPRHQGGRGGAAHPILQRDGLLAGSIIAHPSPPLRGRWEIRHVPGDCQRGGGVPAAVRPAWPGVSMPAAYGVQWEIRRGSSRMPCSGGSPSPRWHLLRASHPPRGVSRARQPPPLRARG